MISYPELILPKKTRDKESETNNKQNKTKNKQTKSKNKTCFFFTHDYTIIVIKNKT